MKLSKYFTLEELIASQFAARHGIDNYPSSAVLPNILKLAKNLDEVRELLGKPVVVSSGYRCPELNRALKSDITSTHVIGLAADFTSPSFGTPREVFDAIKISGIRFDQLILEFPGSPSSWIHIGFDNRTRQQKLTFDGLTYKAVL